MSNHHQILALLALSTFALSWTATMPVYAESAGRYMDDATITTKVKEAILTDSLLNVLQMKIDTIQGAVSLKGTVDTREQENEFVRVTLILAESQV